MLLQLNIKDFAIIDSLQISFGKGLNILTGETGAGKSIIVDAVKLILGDRASTDDIRSTKDEAVVEALFDVSACGVGEILEMAGFPDEENLIIRRIVSRSGKGKAFINGSMENLSLLREICSRIIDIYGQHEHQSLTRPEEHIDILDEFGSLMPIRREMTSAYKEFSSTNSELEGLVLDSQRLVEKLHFNGFFSLMEVDANIVDG